VLKNRKFQEHIAPTGTRHIRGLGAVEKSPQVEVLERKTRRGNGGRG